jgi:hypothetical protein
VFEAQNLGYMAFNSTRFREKLRQRNLDPVTRSRRQPHRNCVVDPTAKYLPEEWRMEGIWSLESDWAEMQVLIDDVQDFLQQYRITLDQNCKNPSGTIRFLRDSSEIVRNIPQIKIHLSPACIEIITSDVRECWLGWLYLEQMVRCRHAPIFSTSIIPRQAVWEFQISQPPYGANLLVPDLDPEFLSDDNFRVMIHAGVTEVLIYGDMLCYMPKNLCPELAAPEYHRNITILRETVQRAAAYGLQIFWVPVSPKLPDSHPLFQRDPEMRGALMGNVLGSEKIHNLCSSSPHALALHRAFFMNLFAEVPLLGGIILIVGGESYYHCFMNPEKTGIYSPTTRTNCPRCAHHSPEQIIANFVKNTAEGVQQSQPHAKILVWPYSAHKWSADLYQIGFIEALAEVNRTVPGLTFHSEMDKDHWLKKPRYSKSLWDYSLEFTGPTDRLDAQIEACKDLGIPYAIKTETALGLEFLHMPYIPGLQRAATKWQNIARLQPRGVTQAWMFFGMWGSRSEELGWWTVWHPELSGEEIVHTLAVRDFGSHASLFVSAWAKISDALGHIPRIPPYYQGPEFLGPAHPLLPSSHYGVPSVFCGALMYELEREDSASDTVWQRKNPLTINRFTAPIAGFIADNPDESIAIFIEEYRTAMDLVKDAYKLIEPLKNSGGTGNPDAADRLTAEECLIIEFFYRTLVSCYHTYQFLALREILEQTNDNSLENNLKSIVHDELENTLAAIPLYAAAPWLDVKERYDGVFASSLAMIAEKRRIIRDFFEIGE